MVSNDSKSECCDDINKLFIHNLLVVNLFLERRSYDVIESQSSVEICVVLTKGILSTPMNINIFDAQGTAKYQCK